VALGASALAVVVVVGPVAAQGHQEYDVDTSAKNEVRFTSSAQVLTFDGVTNRIDGYVLLSGRRLRAGSDSAGTRLHLEVDLGSLDTGVGMRNRHMRDDYLEVKKYPYAVYTGVIERVEATDSGAYRVTAAGTMEIHGVKKRMEVPCEVTEAGPGYRAHCLFHVRLPDFRIEIPKLMFLKLSDDIALDVAFTAAPAG